MELTGAVIVPVPSVLNPRTVADLRSHLEAAFADADVSAVVLLGEEQVFCRGLDLGSAACDPALQEALEDFAACLEAIRMGSKPVIGLVRGEATAGGVGLAAACDGLLATKEATFTLSELLFGLTPAIILPYLAQRLAPQKLRWMGLTARTITSAEALQLGLVDRVCASEEAPSVLRGWLRELSRVPPQAVRLWKGMTIHPPAPGFGEGVRITSEVLRDPAVRAGIQTFLETGHPPWMKREP